MKIAEIVTKLLEAKQAYYDGQPVISDEEFDGLEDTLRGLDPTNEYFSIVGAGVNTRNKVHHEIPMMSCQKAKTVEELLVWAGKMGITNELLVLEPKIDGLSCSVVYENGKLARIATRGDGLIGQDVSHIAQYVNIPKSINLKGRVEIRGELYLPKNTNFPNPENKPLRNIAVGLINRKDSGLKDLRYVHFVSYQVLGGSFRYEIDKLDWLDESGFETIVTPIGACRIDQVQNAYDLYLSEWRETWQMETDGMVFVVNDTEKWEQLDAKYTVDHHHHYNIALKPPSQMKETKLNSIEWNVTRLGRFVPVAIFEPVIIGGATISRCTLNNLEYAENLGLHRGDTILISRANDVIPHIEENRTAHDKMEGDLIPEICFCGTKLVRKGPHLVCTSNSCQDKLIDQILYWVRTCEMDGLSISFVKTMVEAGRLGSIRGLYDLTEKDFEGVEGFASSKVKNALDQIENSKSMTVIQFGDRLGIDLVGEKALTKLGIKTVDDLLNFNGNGSVVAGKLREYLAENKEAVKSLLDVLKVREVSEKKNGGKNVCMTGTGPKGRKELVELITAKGDTFVDHVSKDTQILICEDVNGGSSKLQKARKLGVKLVSYVDYFSVAKVVIPDSMMREEKRMSADELMKTWNKKGTATEAE